MLPFSVTFQTGRSVHEQVVYAVKKAIVTGRMQPGDMFPSVRALSHDLKINPNTAHKIVTTLVHEALLEVKPGIGTLVANASPATMTQRSALLEDNLEQLVVEAKRLSLELKDLLDAVKDHWNGLKKAR